MRLKTVGDGKFVVVGVGVLVGRGGFEGGAEALGVDVIEAKFTLAGNPVHRHGAADAFRIAPEMNISLIKGASGEWKQDGIAAANVGDRGGEIIEFRPVDDVADRAVAAEVVPMHESCAGFGPRQKSGSADLPATDFLAEIGNGVHAAKGACCRTRAMHAKRFYGNSGQYCKDLGRADACGGCRGESCSVSY
jgi:hypothetical protein